MTRLVIADQSAIQEAAALIRAGELVAFPTETVYGLGANAFDSVAIAKVFAAKGRPTTDPLIVHVSAPQALADVAVNIPALAWRLIDAFWPGPLTLIVPRGARIPPNVSAGLKTVAVRMPAHPVAAALLKAAGVPIAAPSANRFAHTSPTSAQHVFEDLADRIPLILDGGTTPIGVESTIVDVTSDPPRLLRPGGISAEAIQQISPSLEIDSHYVTPGVEALPAPGMLLKHYSPLADLHLFEGDADAVRAAIRSTAQALTRQGQRVGLLIAQEDQPTLATLNYPTVIVGSLTDLEQVAHNLFAALRRLDGFGVEIILARAYPQHGIGQAIMDRLLRAAEGRITRV